MSTPLDAVSNRCRPVPPWNGSLSASRRRRATTRCWKDYRLGEAGSGKREAGVRRLGATLLARVVRASRFPLPASLLFVPALLFSQQTSTATPATPLHPEVVNLTLKGVKNVRQSDLLQNIYTTASYCNSFILKPFCWISKSKYFYTRKYLDHKELERDVLRMRIFYWKRGYRETEVDTAVVKRGSNQVGVTFLIKEGPPTVVSDVIVNQP